MTEEIRVEALTEITINKDEILTKALQQEEVLEIQEPTITVELTESELNTIIVSLGLLPMEDIFEDGEKDYGLTKEQLTPNHIVYGKLLTVAKTKLVGDLQDVVEGEE